MSATATDRFTKWEGIRMPGPTQPWSLAWLVDSRPVRRRIWNGNVKVPTYDTDDAVWEYRPGDCGGGDTTYLTFPRKGNCLHSFTSVWWQRDEYLGLTELRLPEFVRCSVPVYVRPSVMRCIGETVPGTGTATLLSMNRRREDDGGGNGLGENPSPSPDGGQLSMGTVFGVFFFFFPVVVSFFFAPRPLNQKQSHPGCLFAFFSWSISLWVCAVFKVPWC